MARACLGAIRLLQRAESIGNAALQRSSSPLLPCSYFWARHLFGDRRRKKFVDPFNVPTLYTGTTPLRPNDPEIKPKKEPRPPERRNIKRRRRALQKTRRVNANRKKMIEWYRARIARNMEKRYKRWKDNAARLREWKEEARAVYATKKITAIRGLPELLLLPHERPQRLK